MAILGYIVGIILLCLYYACIGFLSMIGLLGAILLIIELIDILIFRKED